MFRSACHILLTVVFFVSFAPFVVAGETQVAKVYRDYPGYIEPPTCSNPRFSDQSQLETAGKTEEAWRSAPAGKTAAWRGICPQAWTLTPMVGYHVFDGGMDLDDDISFGMAIGYNLTSNWALEADVRFTQSETDFQLGDNRDVDIWMIGGSVLYHFLPEQRLVPYLAVGGGGIIYDVDGASGNEEDFIGFWGGGLKYAINDAMALRVDLRHILDHQDPDADDQSDWRHQLSAMAGLTFQFGR